MLRVHNPGTNWFFQPLSRAARSLKNWSAVSPPRRANNSISVLVITRDLVFSLSPTSIF